MLPVCYFAFAPRDYLSTFMKVGTIALLAISVGAARDHQLAVSKFAGSGNGPVFAGSLFPFLFITIACGGAPRAHLLSGTTPECWRRKARCA